MKRLSILLISFASLFVNATVLADTPVGPMNYQGRLLDGTGIPVGYPTPTTATFVARVYDALTGGTLKYQETHANVTVDDGVYSFLVGTSPKDAGDSTWSVELWNCCASVYLEISVNGQTLTPRHQLAAAPYAFQANLALTTNNALALGGTSAAQYNNTLAAICVSGKGKWLELVGKCLGIGAQFPGPTLVNWNTLTASSNFSNLDLSRADVSGINFNGADLSSTVLTKTTYSVQGLSGANLSFTQWNSAVSTDAVAYTLPSSTNLANTLLQNMDMSKWALASVSQTNMEGLSAGKISGCPTTFPTYWECRLMRSTGSNYFLEGPGVNMGANSATSTVKLGISYLDLDIDALANARLDHAILTGVTMTQNFTNTYLYNADLSYSTISNSTFKNAWCALTKFVGTHIENTSFASDVFFNLPDFTDSRLSYVRIDPTISNVKFTRAVLNQVDFTSLGGPDFTNAVLESVRINTQLYGAAPGTIPTFDGTRFYNGFYVAGINIGDVGTMVFKNISFYGGTLSGDLRGMKVTGTISFRDVTFSHLNICGATIPVTGTLAPFPEFASTVIWNSNFTRCPDNNAVANGCNLSGSNHFSTPTAVGSCAATIP